MLALKTRNPVQTDPASCHASGKKIWVDLDNSPHVPFFIPVLRELKARGYKIFLTARDCFQVRELVELANLHCLITGRHWGSNKFLKMAGTCGRAVHLANCVRSEKPDLAVSHGSRSQVLAAAMVGIPSIMIDDYECSTRGIDPQWLMVPDLIPQSSLGIEEERTLRYPGIKEDAYVPEFNPNPEVQRAFGLDGTTVAAVVRPPADEAHYHNPQSDTLYQALMDHLTTALNIKVVLVPRTPKQGAHAREAWKSSCQAGQLVVLDHAVDGLSLMFYSDLVISGGGTMNREAAALGVPVYSIFRGEMGSVDRYLAAKGKLVLLESLDDVKQKLLLQRRTKSSNQPSSMNVTLNAIVNHLAYILEHSLPKERLTAAS